MLRYVCLACRLRASIKQSRRTYHISRPTRQEIRGIRDHLREWQEINGKPKPEPVDLLNEFDDNDDLSSDGLLRLPHDRTTFLRRQKREHLDHADALGAFVHAESGETPDSNARFLLKGDLVEIEDSASSGRPSYLAVFVRRIGNIGQFYSMYGRWIHISERAVQFSVRGWAKKEEVEPLIQYLPSPEDVETNLEALMAEAYVHDLSVPRAVAAPLVARMTRFHEAALEVYRRNAQALDSAHDILSHDTDLQYTDISSAAETLLGKSKDKISIVELFIVRQALVRAGVAFNIDRRSHRITGQLQVRSKEQVRMVERVRSWMREWQDDRAYVSRLSPAKKQTHRPTRGAQNVYDFVKKCQQIIQKSRQTRDVTLCGNVGPSNIQIPLTSKQDCVKVRLNPVFNNEESELVRFMEAWGPSGQFTDEPRLMALPPLILQATGMYENYPLERWVGIVFLQELGTIMPYANRVTFDTQLVLPNSLQSKPLQDLGLTLANMAQSHLQFEDSMAHLRHDWGDLPVYCIDKAGAHEIDDGLSIEKIADDKWWVHVHVANPTACFGPDHPLGKMSRLMGETVYTPERAYTMLPRWATDKHFGLAPDRRCLTFSAQLDASGKMLEYRVRSGIVRNVMRLTPAETKPLISDDTTEKKMLVLRVGGTPPPPPSYESFVDKVGPEEKQQLRWLHQLAVKRMEQRQLAGGIIFDSGKPEVSVWQGWSRPGLAWEYPYRRGGRRVDGDPIIELRTPGLRNWFAESDTPVDTLVREHMLLACEVAATFCEERQVPGVFRGSVPMPDRTPSDVFWEQEIKPVLEANGTGTYPMHLGMQYMETFGTTRIATKPFRHQVLGMNRYGKATSPLRRYGDMIIHWQIEAALREEARTGRSLITDDRVLPFSRQVLEEMLVSMQPREATIARAKTRSEQFWMAMLVFRILHFPGHPSNSAPGTSTLPFPHVPATDVLTSKEIATLNLPSTTVPLCRVYVHIPLLALHPRISASCLLIDLNMDARMLRPEGMELPEVRRGDLDWATLPLEEWPVVLENWIQDVPQKQPEAAAVPTSNTYYLSPADNLNLPQNIPREIPLSTLSDNTLNTPLTLDTPLDIPLKNQPYPPFTPQSAFTYPSNNPPSSSSAPLEFTEAPKRPHNTSEHHSFLSKPTQSYLPIQPHSQICVPTLSAPTPTNRNTLPSPTPCLKKRSISPPPRPLNPKKPTPPHRSTHPSGGSLSEDDKLLLSLKASGLPWKEIAEKFALARGHTVQIAALQMRYKRLRERGRIWTEKDLRNLAKAVDLWEEERWVFVAKEMEELGSQEQWSADECEKMWVELDMGS
ncbi:RNB-domain-containing protein [Piedraia hortae CBS 480.64]|uniref:RNB-domain-containing protein n=1 Tax=Piedraia hortae CBS 480.64 TaxID=1314780 RepID=A0A6A7C5U2_9PEZI|nr:RNB-domain-containing protein [Piedraia hortae CBS 480.64]